MNNVIKSAEVGPAIASVEIAKLTLDAQFGLAIIAMSGVYLTIGILLEVSFAIYSLQPLFNASLIISAFFLIIGCFYSFKQAMIPNKHPYLVKLCFNLSDGIVFTTYSLIIHIIILESRLKGRVHISA